MPTRRRHDSTPRANIVPAGATPTPEARTDSRSARPERTWPQLSTTADGLVRLAALVTVAVYVLGMLITNAYLFALGLADFAMVRPRFALVGFTFAALLVAITLPTALAWTLERRRLLADGPAGHSAGRWVWLRALLSLRTGLGVLLSFAVLYWVSLSLDEGSLNPLDRVFYKWYLAYGASLLLFGCVHFLMRGGALLTDEPGVLVVTGALVLLLPFLVYSASVNILPALPEQVGGAREKQVQFLVGPEEVAGLRSAGIPFGEQTTVSRPVTLLFDATTLYVVRLEDERLIQVDKRLVKAVILQRR